MEIYHHDDVSMNAKCADAQSHIFRQLFVNRSPEPAATNDQHKTWEASLLFWKLTEYEFVKVGKSSLCHNQYLYIVSEIMKYWTSFEDLLLTVTFIVRSLALVGKTIVSFVFS